jgi:hypothetical protein
VKVWRFDQAVSAVMATIITAVCASEATRITKGDRIGVLNDGQEHICGVNIR